MVKTIENRIFNFYSPRFKPWAIDETDKEIDKMVYALYELSEEEIAVVEGNG